MPKKNDTFFVEKKVWSKVKDELLGCYFKPYVSKILHTYKPLVYVDCFAGKGKFEDDNPGSPLIALDIISKCQESTKIDAPHIEAIFIDLNYADELKENLKSYPWVKIISGKYEDNIHNILMDKNGFNVFLYVDPYGIKALQCSIFDDFSSGRFNSIELLVNMNSFGFIREACHAMGTSFDEQEIFEDLVEYEPTKMDASKKSINELNDIAGGDYWQTIIASYNNHEITGYQAEAQFAEKYCNRLMKSYKYVLNMPLRIKQGQRPKYRLIHATNHRDGCLLMVDNIRNRWDLLQDIQNCGQMQFFTETPENEIIDEADIRNKTEEHFSRYTAWSSLHDTLADFFVKYGPICATTEVKKILQQLQKDGDIHILRFPDTTSNGRPTKYMSENGKQTVSVRWRT